ncbi:MAG: hypothetical protein ACYS9X_32880 [Planctomycetota bacterium]|jgi:hypothetical protein
MYFEEHHETMGYAAYRAKGWPTGSGSVESACGQFAVKAAILSGDGRWGRRRPAPIPAPDPAASTTLAYAGQLESDGPNAAAAGDLHLPADPDQLGYRRCLLVESLRAQRGEGHG